MEFKEKAKSLKIGDTVTRFLTGIPQPLKITKITDDSIICGWWEFSKNTGGEIDEDLGWDGKTITGSFIVI